MSSFGIDPALDIAGRIGTECFLCGKKILRVEPFWFGPARKEMPNALRFAEPDMSVRLPIHPKCLDGKTPAFVAREYNRRLHDLAGVSRTN